MWGSWGHVAAAEIVGYIGTAHQLGFLHVEKPKKHHEADIDNKEHRAPVTVMLIANIPNINIIDKAATKPLQGIEHRVRRTLITIKLTDGHKRKWLTISIIEWKQNSNASASKSKSE